MFVVGEGCFGFFFKQKTAYEMRISDWSSDVCSSDLLCREVMQFGDDGSVAFRRAENGRGRVGGHGLVVAGESLGEHEVDHAALVSHECVARVFSARFV